MALPVSAGQQARIDTINTGIAGLPSIFNPKRRSLAYETAAGLNESGLLQGANVEEVNEGGNIVYRLVRGPDGRLYSQAFRQINAAQADRGAFYSSANVRGQREARRELDTRVNQAFRGFGAAQQDLTDQQAAEDRRLRGELGVARGEYADWQAAQPVPDPGADAAAAAAAGPAAVPVRGPARAPGVARSWTGANAPDLAFLSKAWGVPRSRIRVRTPTRPGSGYEAYLYN